MKPVEPISSNKLIEQQQQNERQLEVFNTTYRLSTPTTSYLNVLAHYDEINTQFYEEESYVASSFLYQEI